MLASLITRLLSYLAVKLLTEAFIVELIVTVLEKGAKKTTFTWDDELVQLIRKHLRIR